MNPQLKALVAQATKLLRGAGFSLPKALCLIALAVLGMAILAGALTFLAVWGMSEVILSIVNMSASGNVVGGAWIPKQFGLLAGVGMFFMLTVGILLTIEELRNWLLKFLGAGVILAALGGIYGAVLPVVADNPSAKAFLVGLVLLVGATGILTLFGQEKALRVGWLAVPLGLLLVVSLLWGGGMISKKAPPSREVKTVRLHRGRPEGHFANTGWEMSDRFDISPLKNKYAGWTLDPSSACGVVIINDRTEVPQCGGDPEILSLRERGFLGEYENIRILQFRGKGMQGMAYGKYED